MDEHTAFSKLTTSLREAEDAINWIAIHRADQRKGWETIAQLLQGVRDTAYNFQMTIGGKQ